MLKAYKTKLRPTREQARYFHGCAGLSRFVFNWALADRIAMHEAGTPTTMFRQKKRFNALKHNNYAWCKEYPYAVVEYAFRDLDQAYTNFFSRIKSEAPRSGFPKFKSRAGRKSFRFRDTSSGDTAGYAREEAVKVPRLGWVRLAERGYIPTNKKIKYATISLDVDQWFVSALVEDDESESVALDGVIGIDVGVSSMAYCSDGTQFAPSDRLKKSEKKLANLQKKLARQKKGSGRHDETKRKIAKLHREIRRHRSHVQHNASAYVTRHAKPEAIAIETLNVAGMTRRPKPKPREDGDGYERNNARAKAGLNKAILNSGIGELHRQIKYKAEWLGIEVVEADRWFASSKTCSGCGHINKELKLSDRSYACPECGLVIDRDFNAARNLAALVNP